MNESPSFPLTAVFIYGRFRYSVFANTDCLSFAQPEGEGNTLNTYSERSGTDVCGQHAIDLNVMLLAGKIECRDNVGIFLHAADAQAVVPGYGGTASIKMTPDAAMASIS